ncbi:MAG: cyclic nucleotide-binding domain-containing protein [Thiohalobacterales bacterium]|nr:cyclic nucleotide-binding domain-containing protein [Thiohalobacterales bacterium]
MTQDIDYNILMNSLLGQDLDQRECSILAGLMGTRQLQDGEDLVSEGDTSWTLFVLAAGKIEVLSMVAGNEVNLYHMHIGECAGTRAFVEKAPRMATLRAEGGATVYTLEPGDLESLLDTEPQIVYKFMRGLFRQTHANLMRVDAESQQLSNYINKIGGRY